MQFQLTNITKLLFSVIVLVFLTGCDAAEIPTNEQAEILNQPTSIPNIVEISIVPTHTLAPTPTTNIPTNTYLVTKVTDGDTITVSRDGIVEKVRLIGVDTPETVDPRKEVQCFGKEASEYLKNMLTGKSVVLESDPTQGDKDRYARLLRYVYTVEGILVNKAIIENGYGYEYTYKTPYKYQTEFKNAQKYASENKIGLWADNACQAQNQNTQIMPRVEGAYTCNCTKSCTQIKSCDEAYFQLNNCGCGQRDGDKDGVPCESICR